MNKVSVRLCAVDGTSGSGWVAVTDLDLSYGSSPLSAVNSEALAMDIDSMSHDGYSEFTPFFETTIGTVTQSALQWDLDSDGKDELKQYIEDADQNRFLLGLTTSKDRIKFFDHTSSDTKRPILVIFYAPKSPSGLAATKGTDAEKVRITWSASVGNVSYQVYKGTVNNTSYASPCGGSTANTYYDDFDAEFGATYYYWVKATDAYGDSSVFGSSTSGYCKWPGPVADAASNIDNDSFMANWQEGVGSSGWYELDVSTSSTFGSYVTGYKGLAVNGRSQKVSGLSPNTSYYYRVRSTNSNGKSDNSSSKLVLTAPAAPTITGVGEVTSNSFKVSWTSSSGAKAYLLYVSTDINFGSFVSGYAGLDVGNVTSRTVSGLSAGTMYYFYVKSYNSSAISRLDSVWQRQTLFQLTYAAGTGGHITGMTPQSVSYGGSGTSVSADPETGYSFLNWSDGGTSNPRVDSNVRENRSVTANFSQQTATITVAANPANGGTVSGGGTFPVGSQQSISAEANTGWSFTSWSDGNTQTPRTVTVPAGGATYTANFTQQNYTITTLSNPTAGGTTGGGGSKASGSQCTVTATANSGYTFANWTEGGSVVSTSANYTFTVTGNRTLTANFNPPNNYTITTVSSPSAGGTTGGGGSKASGSSCTVTAKENSGYTFANWTEGGSVVSTSANYTFTVTGNRTLTANFNTPNNYTLTVQSLNPASGIVISSSSGHGGTTPYSKPTTSGTSVNLLAPQYFGFGTSRKRFNSWSGPVSGTSQALALTMNGNMSVTANYIDDPDTDVRVLESATLFYRAAETSGTTVADERGSNNGTLNEPSSVSFFYAAELERTCLRKTDSTTGGVTPAHAPITQATFSMACWARPAPGGGGQFFLIAGEPEKTFWVYPSQIGYQYTDRKSYPNKRATFAEDGGWHLFTWVNQDHGDGTATLKMFVDGNKLYDGLLTASEYDSRRPANQKFLCQRPYSYFYYQYIGDICNIAMFDGIALGDSQVSQLVAETDPRGKQTLGLQITPDKRNVTKYAGTTTFSVANSGSGTMPWTASVTSGGTWARITSGSSGSNAGTVTVVYDANPAGGETRTATIRVTATGATGSPQEVSVVQDPNPDSGTVAQDDFESYSLNTWPSRWSADGNASATANNKVVSDPANSANKVLKLYGVLGSYWGALGYLPCSIPNDFTLEVRVYNGTETIPSSGHQSRCGVGLRKGTYWGNYGRGLISFDKNGNATRIDGTVIGQYTLGIWHQIKLQYHRTSTSITVTYWMNGVAAGSASQVLTDVAGENSQDHIDLGVNAGSGYFDNLVVTRSVVTSPEIDIRLQNGNSVERHGIIGLGNLQSGTNYDLMLYVFNTGNAPLTINRIDFSVYSDAKVIEPLNTSIPGGGSDSFTVRIPIGTGLDMESITVHNNDLDEPDYDIDVQWKGVTEASLAITPEIRRTPPNAGSTTFSVANSGSGTMAWTAAVISGGAWARITSGASGSNSGTVTVGYDANPAGGETRTATIRVTATGAAGSPVDVTVTQEPNGDAGGGSALPAWAWGTFNGYDVNGGLASMTVSSKGIITGKLTFGGTSYSFSSAAYASGDEESGYVVIATAKGGKAALPVSLRVYEADALLGAAEGEIGGERVMLYRNLWKDAGMAAVADNYDGYYTANLTSGGEYGSGYLTFTVDKAGKVKAAGKLADGTTVSLGGTLILDGNGYAYAVVYAAPAAYKGGSLFGLAEFVNDESGSVILRLLDGGLFRWESRNPQATGNYGAGFSRSPGLTGGLYDKLLNLYNHYGNGLIIGDVDLPELPISIKFTDWTDDSHTKKKSWTETNYTAPPAGGAALPAGLVLILNAAGTGFTAPKADTPVKDAEKEKYNYDSDTDGDGVSNTSGLTFTFARSTGLFKGSFKAWYDYTSAIDNTTDTGKSAHTSKNVTFQGALTPVREEMTNGIAGRGFYLCPAKGSYEDAAGKTKTYNFNRSYDFLLLGN